MHLIKEFVYILLRKHSNVYTQEFMILQFGIFLKFNLSDLLLYDIMK